MLEIHDVTHMGLLPVYRMHFTPFSPSCMPHHTISTRERVALITAFTSMADEVASTTLVEDVPTVDQLMFSHNASGIVCLLGYLSQG